MTSWFYVYSGGAPDQTPPPPRPGYIAFFIDGDPVRYSGDRGPTQGGPSPVIIDNDQQMYVKVDGAPADPGLSSSGGYFQNEAARTEIEAKDGRLNDYGYGGGHGYGGHGHHGGGGGHHGGGGYNHGHHNAHDGGQHRGQHYGHHGHEHHGGQTKHQGGSHFDGGVKWHGGHHGHGQGKGGGHGHWQTLEWQKSWRL